MAMMKIPASFPHGIDASGPGDKLTVQNDPHPLVINSQVHGTVKNACNW